MQKNITLEKLIDEMEMLQDKYFLVIEGNGFTALQISPDNLKMYNNDIFDLIGRVIRSRIN